MKIEGRLEDIGLKDLLDLLHMKEATCVVHIETPRGEGNIYLRKGDVIHAEYERLRGLPAFTTLLAFNSNGSGNWYVEIYKTPAEETINQDFETLMEEDARGVRTRFATLLDTLVTLRILERVDVW